MRDLYDSNYMISLINCLNIFSVQRNFMVAMYIIFLGILPAILLVLFLMYYSRHNVLSWWKKPRKTYVPHFNFTTFTNSGSFVNLLRRKYENKPNNKSTNANECNVKRQDIPSNKLENTKDNTANKGVWYKGIARLGKKNESAKVLKRFNHKINKEDIKVSLDSLEFKDAITSVPNKSKESVPLKSKANIVIINTGLASTTNENINKIGIHCTTKSNVNDIKNYNVDNDVKNSNIDKVNTKIQLGKKNTTSEMIKSSNTRTINKNVNSKSKEEPGVGVKNLTKKFENSAVIKLK